MKQQETLFDKIISRIKNNPVAAFVIALGTVVIALSTFTNAAKNLFGSLTKQRPEAARIELSQMSLQYTPGAFVESAKKGDVYAVKLFLNAGMDPNAKDKDGDTALMYAARSHANMLDVLLRAKANVNEKDRGGETALSWAALAGNMDTLRILLDQGADAEAINKAFAAAARGGHQEVLRVLLKRGASLSKVGSRALMATAGSTFVRVTDNGLSETVRFLLDLGVDVNAKNEEGWTALLLASDRRYGSVARTLLERGADINAKCDCPGYLDGGWAPLMIAVKNGLSEVVEMLLARGADVNVRNNRGQTALMLAVDRNDTGIVRALLERGARLNEKDVNGKTALQLAQESLEGKTRAEMVGLLKKAGAK